MNTSLTASSTTDCKEQPLWFQDLGSRKVVADFSGGMLSSDGGALLLRQVDVNLGLTQSLAQCFRDTREQVYVDHSVAGPTALWAGAGLRRSQRSSASAAGSAPGRRLRKTRSAGAGSL